MARIFTVCLCWPKAYTIYRDGATRRGRARHFAARLLPGGPVSLLLGLLFVASGLVAGCCGAAPQEVQDAIAHTLEDVALCEAEVLPLVPDDATVLVTTLAGVQAPAPARVTWWRRLRGLRVRLEGLQAWAKDETFDVDAALAKALQTELKGP